jgi:sugar lactone lactonase YvrE
MKSMTSAQTQLFPGHDGGDWAPVPSKIVATWPAGTFAENLAVLPDGSILISLHSHKRIDRYDPANGQLSTFAELPAPAAGLSFDANGQLWVTGGALGAAPGYVWRVDRSGAAQPWVEIADAYFMNGCAFISTGTLLVCESATGRLLAVDTSAKKWRVWLSDRRLAPTDPQMPGANGIKVYGSHAYVSVTDSNILYRIKLEGGEPAGPLEVVAENLRADDFAFASSGALYIATHPAQSVVRLAPNGRRTTIAGPEQGTVGSTACAFGRPQADDKALYVTTTGGVYFPYQGVLQEAKLVRLDVGEAGAPLLHGAR